MSLKPKSEELKKEVQTGEEIITGCAVLEERYTWWRAREYLEKNLKGKLIVSASRWAEIKRIVEKMQDNPTCDLSFKPSGYQVSIKDIEKLKELVRDG